MKPISTKILVVPALAAGIAVLAGCNSGGSHTAAEQSAKARASAAAQSTAGQKAKSDAQLLLKQCPVPQGAAQLSKTAWKTWMGCADVPQKNWKNAAGCVLTNAEHGGKLPKDHQARETALINDAFPCVQKYHGASK
jgi:glucose/arabinose dehydrogenase